MNQLTVSIKTPEQLILEKDIRELIKCKEDPIYFIENHLKVVDVKTGLKVPLKLTDSQKIILLQMHEGRMTSFVTPRQYGKSTLVRAYALWCSVFNDDQMTVIATTNSSMAKHTIAQIKDWIYDSPLICRSLTIIAQYKDSVLFNNNCRLIVQPVRNNSFRGMTISTLLMDDVDLPDPAVGEYLAQIFPVFTGNQHTKIVLSATNPGMSLVQKIAEQREDFTNITISRGQSNGQ